MELAVKGIEPKDRLEEEMFSAILSELICGVNQYHDPDEVQDLIFHFFQTARRIDLLSVETLAKEIKATIEVPEGKYVN